jgi:hypothetical protein
VLADHDRAMTAKEIDELIAQLTYGKAHGQ